MTPQQAHAQALRFMADAIGTDANLSPVFRRAVHDDLARQADEAESGSLVLGMTEMMRRTA
jgi:hypothetical protein